MKLKKAHILPGRIRLGCSLIGSVILTALSLSAQTIPNPSFESNTFTVFPGYVSGNTQITGWTASPQDRVGLNPAGGSPFANNGAIPDGANVAFLQSSRTNVDDLAPGSTLSTTVSGLTAGTTYKLTMRVNARQNANATSQTPHLRVFVGTTEVIGLTVYSVATANAYTYLAAEFTATASSEQLTLLNDQVNDNTVLVDDLRLGPSSGKWAIAAWTDDTMADPGLFYSHAYNFNSANDVFVNGVTFKGIAGGNPAVAGQFSTTLMDSMFNGDVNNVTLSGVGSAGLATDFLYHGGPISGGAFQGITLQGLTPGKEYLFTVFSMGWEEPNLDNRWVTFSIGEDRITVNQDKYGNDNGILVSYRYVADASGSVTIKIIPFNPSNVSFHTYAFANRRTTSDNVAPVITQQPQSATVSEGVPVTLVVSATGFPAPTYQWRKNNVNISGANAPTYTIDPTTPADVGSYDVVVANVAGSVTSAKAKLTIGLPMTNPSFEVDWFYNFPGYVSGNLVPITGWDSLPNHGINPCRDVARSSPFADNGTIPHGEQVAFMQGDGALSQTINGLTVGSIYYVHYYENARGPGATSIPAMEVKVGGTTVVATHIVSAVGSGPYHEMYTDQFTATSSSMLLEFIKSNPNGGDSTSLIDNVAVVVVPPGSAPFVSRNPNSLGVSVGDSATFTGAGIGTPPLAYQWLKNGEPMTGKTDNALSLPGVQTPDVADYSLKISNTYGAVTSTVARLTVFQPIPGLYNTGVDNNRAPLPAGAIDPHFTLITNPDNTGTNALVEGVIPWGLANNASSQWIGPKINTVDSAIGAFTYRVTFDLTGRDPKTVYIEGRWAVDNAGSDILVNGVPTGNPNGNGFNTFTTFTLIGTNINFVAGLNTIDFVVDNQGAIGYTGLRLEFVKSNVQVPPGIPPSFISNPASKDAAEGDSVTFSASVTGSSPMTYQWRKNGTPIPGKTDLTLTIPSVLAADAGSYTMAVTNLYGYAISQPAVLTVSWRPIAGLVFGTGIAADGTLAPALSVDPHYIMSASADPGWTGPDAYVLDDVWPVQAGVWLLNGPNSKWIAPQPDQSGTAGNLPGNYTFQTTFNLSGYDPSLIKVEGQWAVDNAGTALLLNGTPTGATSGGFNSWSPFTLTTGFNAGVNTLDFVINNAESDPPTGLPGPTGLRVDLKAYLNIAPPPIRLQATRSGNNLSVSWTPNTAGTVLQSAVDLTGPWTDLVGASNPFTTNITPAKLFFRVKK